MGSNGRGAIHRVRGAAPADVAVWDCHVHLYGDPPHQRGLRLLEASRRLGIQKLFASRLWAGNRVPATATPDQFQVCNRSVERWIERAPDQILGNCFVSCTYPDEAERELEECIERRGFRGLKLYAACRYDDPRVLPVVARAARYGIPVLLHVTQRRVNEAPGQYASDAREVAYLAERLPGAKLILAHLNGGGDWAFSIKTARPYPNIFLDISGSSVDAGMVEAAYEAVGAERLLFGTDSSMCEGVGKLQGAEIPEQAKQLIWGANLQRLLQTKDVRTKDEMIIPRQPSSSFALRLSSRCGVWP
ncbi:MAG: amidohydrolase [Chloroflexi bacterium]|nr:amidohydrolase [Chloroflexota bacterium]